MKELYIAPEVKRLGFLPEEKLASLGGSFDDLLNAGQTGGGGTGFQEPGSATVVDPGDVGLPL